MTKIIYNYNKLLGRMREQRLTQSEVAKSTGISEVSLNLKLNNKSSFKQSEIIRICDVLSIPLDNITTYFFAK
jgi:transcriptional regulator with XRE-family HTH domain